MSKKNPLKNNQNLELVTPLESPARLFWPAGLKATISLTGEAGAVSQKVVNNKYIYPAIYFFNNCDLLHCECSVI